MPASTTSPQSKFIRYVVVVHGIGEQRKNETTLHVVERFAAARRDAANRDDFEVLTLGKACGQTGTAKPPKQDDLPWMEFAGVPRDRLGDRRPFFGQKAVSGENLRFVDLCWSDIMQTESDRVVQDVRLWSNGLLGRLRRKNLESKNVPYWIPRILKVLVDTLLIFELAMRLRVKSFQELIFVKFLGDVQQYGEFPQCRGKAIRRFHEMFSVIEERHRRLHPRVEARYTIIAHSLGTIMSLDALLYALAKNNVRKGAAGDCPANLPFDGYLSVPELAMTSAQLTSAIPKTDWIDRVDAFVTLGSPIDKYLVLWWGNYHYLNDPNWMRRPRRRIAHYNYCDEQDPVGHNLNVAQTAPAFSVVFETKEDIVFNRYSVPGVAHNDYWKDQDLFAWILAHAVDGKPGGVREPDWFDEKAYGKLLNSIYRIVPYSIVLLEILILSVVFHVESLASLAAAAAAFALTTLLGRKIIDLTVWWRQIQRSTCDKAWKAVERLRQGRDGANSETASNIGQWLKGERLEHFREINERRNQTAAAFRERIQFRLVLTLFACAVLSWLYIAMPDDSLVEYLRKIAAVVAVLAIVWFFYIKCFRGPNTHPMGLTSLNVSFSSWGIVAACGAAGAGLGGWTGLPASLSFLGTYGEWLPKTIFHVTLAIYVAAAVLAYRHIRFRDVKQILAKDCPSGPFESDVDFPRYAKDNASV